MGARAPYSWPSLRPLSTWGVSHVAAAQRRQALSGSFVRAHAGNRSSLYGGLAVAVPLELKGLEVRWAARAHSRSVPFYATWPRAVTAGLS